MLKKVPSDGAQVKSHFQKERLKITRKVRNSNLPASIPKDKTHFEKFGISSKLYAGPIKLPKPGPTFDIDVEAAETDVKISRPDKERRNEIKKIIKSMGEKCKVSVRNIRREANDELKKLLKNKEISEDKIKKKRKNYPGLYRQSN